jgi:hypothetical protein
MPSLLEILNDPNYVNANEATKEAIFNKYSAQDKNYTDANDATKEAIRTKFGIGAPAAVAEPEPTKDTGIFSMAGRALARGAKQTGSLLGDVLPAMAASAVGADEYAARQMAEAAETQKEIEQKYGARYKSLEDVKGVGDYLPFALETALEQVPGMATALVPGAGFGVAGGRMAAAAAAKKAAERGAAEAAAAKYGAQAAATGAMRGQIGGAFLGSYALNAPEVFQNIFEETGGQMEPAAAALAGSVSAALDSILPVAILKQMGPNVKAGVVENLLEKSGMPSPLARKVVGATVTGAGTEGLTEGAQEAISIAAEKFVQENPEVWGSKEFNRLIESSVRGAVGGGAFGAAGAGAGAYLEGRRERLEQRQLDADRREIIAGDLATQLGRDPTEEEIDTVVAATDRARKEMQDESTSIDTRTSEPSVSVPSQEELGKGPVDTGAPELTETDLDRINRLAADAGVREEDVYDQLKKEVQQKVEGVVLTPDAEALLRSVEAGGTPAMMTNNLKRIAKENGIKVTAKDTPNSVIDKLKELKAAQLTKEVVEPEEVTEPTITEEPQITEEKPSADTTAARSYIQRVESGSIKPNAVKLKGFINALGLDVPAGKNYVDRAFVELRNNVFTPEETFERQISLKAAAAKKTKQPVDMSGVKDLIESKVKKILGYTVYKRKEDPDLWYVQTPENKAANKIGAGDEATTNLDTARSRIETYLQEDTKPQYETIKSKPGANVPRVAKMLGGQLYGSMKDITEVSVKEMVQNSFDAIKTSLEQGQITKGKIDIEIDKTNRSIKLTDNGSGMTPDVLGNVFLTIAGTNKETEFGSGGFGIAKMLFLYNNNNISVTTMRNGQISQMEATGAQLLNALEDPAQAPNIEVMTANEYGLNRANRDFPEGHGTIVTVTVPETYVDPGTGKTEGIRFHSDVYSYDTLRYSPLFANIDVTLNGDKVNIGANFPIKDYETFVNADFDWGTARIYVSKQQGSTYGRNLHVLSNGLWQFSEKLVKDMQNMWSDPIPYTFYVDIVSKVKPEEPGYPFSLNRKGFTEEAGQNLNLVKNYLYIQYQQKALANESASFGNVHYLYRRGASVKASSTQDLNPKIQRVELKNKIDTGAKVKIENGKLIVDGKVIPALTPEDLKKAQIDTSKLKIPQDKIKPYEVMVHDNLEVNTNEQAMRLQEISKRQTKIYQDIDDLDNKKADLNFILDKKEIDFLNAKRKKLVEENEALSKESYGLTDTDVKTYKPISEAAKEKFGNRFDKFMYEIGDAFMALRDRIVYLNITDVLPTPKGLGTKSYSDLANVAIGISFDKEYRGVSTLIPFEGVFVNPLAVEFADTPEQAAFGLLGTMIHELAHYQQRNHSAEFAAEMQRLTLHLRADKDFNINELERSLVQAIKSNQDIFDYLRKAGLQDDAKSIGQRFEDSSFERKTERATKDLVESREAGQLGSGLLSDFGPRYQTIGPEQRPSGVSPQSAAVERKRRNLNSSPKTDKVSLNDPLFKAAHPTVTTAIANNDVQGALRALKNTAGKFLSGLADRLMQLNLNTVVGFDDLHYDLSIKSLDRVKGQKIRIMNWLQQVKPAVYASRFDESKMKMPVTETLKAFEDFRDGKLGIDPKMFKEDLEDIIKVYDNAVTSLNAPGTYFMDDNAIGLSLTRGGNSNYAIAHEFSHAATHWAIDHPDELNPKQRLALANLYRLFRYAKKHTKNPDAYGYNNLHEFVAEAFSRPSFQNELRQMQRVMDTNMSAWSKFIQLVAQLFGVDNVLFHTLANADVLFSANSGSATNKGPGLLWAPSRYSVRNGTFKLNPGERIGFIDKAVQLRKNWKSVDKSNLKNFFGSLNNQYRRYLLGALTVDQLADIYGSDMPQLKAYVKEVDAMLATRNAILKEGAPIIGRWSNLLQSNPEKAKQLGQVMIESTLEKMDPSILDPQLQQILSKKDLPDLLAKYDSSSLKDAWREMSSGKDGDVAVEIYKQVRNFYERRMNEYIQVQEARIREAGLAKSMTPQEIDAKVRAFRAEIEESIIRPYFPIKRFGDYFLMVGRGRNKIFMQFEDAFARDAELEKQRARLLKTQVKDKDTGETRTYTEEEAAAELWPGQGFNEVLNQKLNEVTQLNKIKALVDETTEDILKSTDPQIMQDRVAAMQEQLKDAFGQYYLELLPSESIKKMFLHRQNVAGPSQDMLRAFSLSYERIAYQRARFQHMPSLFNIVEAAKLRSMSMPTTEEKAVYGDVANELAKQFKSGVLEPPKHSKLTTFLTHFGFLNFLTSPASAVVNMMAIPGLYIPVAGSRYGGVKRVGTVVSKYVRMLGGTGYINEETNRYEFLSLARANLQTLTDVNTRDGANKINLPKGKTLADVYTAGVNRGAIDTTLVHDSVSIGESPSEDYTGRWQKFMYYASLPFHAAEKFNREVSYMTSFELAYEKNITDKKMTPEAAFEAALDQARDLTQETMFNYNSTNKPRYFRGNIANVLLQFKLYPQHMCVLMFRTFQKGFMDGEKAELDAIRAQLQNAPEDVLNKALADKRAELAGIKKEARDAFLGMMGMSFLTAGMTGMPLWFIFSGVASAFHAVFGDDDEPFDADNWFKNWANRTFGGFAGDTISRGLLSQVTGMNFADRMNLNLPDMWFPDVRKSQSEVDYVQNMFINTLGPSLGALLVSYPEAVKRFNDGHTERAVEALMPAGIKNVMVGTRYMVEGQALTLKGNTLVEDISAREALSQMLGFSPERVAQKQQAAFQTKNANETIMNRRTDLLNAFFIAVDTGDANMMAKVIDKMVAFSQTNPGVAIDPDKLVDSIAKRYTDRALANITGGMGLNKNLIPQLLPMLEYGER